MSGRSLWFFPFNIWWCIVKSISVVMGFLFFLMLCTLAAGGNKEIAICLDAKWARLEILMIL